MQFEQDVREVIIQTLSVKPEEIKLDKNLYDSLGVDSTEMVDLRIALEKKFDVKINGKEISKSSSPEDIIRVIESKRSVS